MEAGSTGSGRVLRGGDFQSARAPALRARSRGAVVGRCIAESLGRSEMYC